MLQLGSTNGLAHRIFQVVCFQVGLGVCERLNFLTFVGDVLTRLGITAEILVSAGQSSAQEEAAAGEPSTVLQRR